MNANIVDLEDFEDEDALDSFTNGLMGAGEKQRKPPAVV